MKRECHALALHRIDQQADAPHHHHRVAGLDGYHHIREPLADANPQELHATLHDAFGRVAVTAHDAVRERPVVHPDTDGRVVCAANIQERHKARFQPLQLPGILLVGVFQMLERASRVNVVPRVDAHLLGIECRHLGHARIEMHIGHQRHSAPGSAHPRIDVAQVLRLAHPLRGQPDVFPARPGDAQRLGHARLGVQRGRVCHALQPNGILPSQRCATDLHFHGLPAAVIEQIHHPRDVNCT